MTIPTPSFMEKRSEPRNQIALGRAVQVLVQRAAGDSDAIILGELKDISSGGAQISLPAFPQFSEKIGLQIDVRDAHVTINATASVCWIRPEENNRCLIGCAFAVNLSNAVLGRLAVAGIIERRRHPRRSVSVPAHARWELEAQSFPVEITDYSEGGFCMASGHASSVGASVSVKLEGADEAASAIHGQVCWQEKRDAEYVVGCSVSRIQDVDQLRDHFGVDLDQAEAAEPRPSIGQVGQALSLAVTWVAVFAMTTFLGLKAIESWDRRSELEIRQQPVRVADSDAQVAPPSAKRPTTDYVDFGEVEVQGDSEPQTNTPEVQSEPQTNTPEVQSESQTNTPDVQSEPQTNTPEVQSESQSDTSETHRAGDEVAVPQVNSPPASDTASSALDDGDPQPETSRAFADHDGARPIAESNAWFPTIDPDFLFTRPSIEAWTTLETSLETHPVINDLTPEVRESGDVINRGSSAELQKAREAFTLGDRFYRAGRYTTAKEAFQNATEGDRQNPLYFYLLAMTQYRLGQLAVAQDTVRKAMRLERDRPIENWGEKLSRYQGRPRLWVEQLRTGFRPAAND